MRYFLFSLIFHVVIVIFALSTLKNKLEFKQVGNPKISFTMTGSSQKISGLSKDLVVKKQIQQPQKTEKKKKKVVKEKEITKKKVVKTKKVIEKKIPVKEIKVEEKKIVTNKTFSSPATNTGEHEGKNDTEQESRKKELRNGFIKLADGSIAATNQGVKGLSYGFVSQPEPNYPEIAKKMGFNKSITIKVRFLIGYDGHVEEIKFYDNIENFGFRNEVNKALSQWKTTPITINNQKVKLYFYKKFIFEQI
jgi:outer membrane biosynthesis protein TonB